LKNQKTWPQSHDIDDSIFPATAELLAGTPSLSSAVADVDATFDALSWHAREVVEGALQFDDLATAACVTEAFAQIATHAMRKHNPKLMPPNENAGRFALHQLACNLAQMVCEYIDEVQEHDADMSRVPTKEDA